MSALLLACFTATSAPSILAIDSYTLSGLELPSLFEMVVPHAVVLTEDAGGFGAVDPARISLLGESWTWTRWRIDQHDVTDPFAPGSAVIQLPLAWTSALSVGMTSAPGLSDPSGVDLELNYDLRGVRAGVRTVLPELGGIVPGAVEFMNAISGRHVTERDIPPPSSRRRYVNRIDAWATGGAFLGGGQLSVAADVTDVTRRFLDFDPTTGALERTFDEPASRVTLGAAWKSGERRVLALFEHRERATLGAEAGMALRETMDATTDVLLIGAHVGAAHAALTLERQELTALARSFTREILDVDGEAPQPFLPDGSRLAVTIDSGWSHGPYYLSLMGRALVLRPATRTWSNPLTFAGTPYGRIDWSAAPVTVALGEARAGHHDGVDLGLFRLEWDLYAWAASSGRLLQADLGADLAVTTSLGPFSLFLLGSKSPIAPSPEIALALTPGWMEGRTVLLGDGLVDTWGGSRLSVDDSLSPMQVYTGAIGGTWHLSPRWRIQAQGMLKSIDHTPWITGGSYYLEDDTYYLSPGEKRYVLSDLGAEAPLYFGGQFQLFGADGEDYMLAISFAVFNVVGRTAPGNGPLSNDPGIIDRATANPSARTNQLANTDADRAFLTKAVFGRRIVDTLWGFITLRHRDGQPFAFPDPRTSRSGQVTMVADTPRGSPFKYSRPLDGPREDFRLDVDVQLAWNGMVETTTRVDLSVTVSNLLDMGNELAEVQVRPARTGRGALEMQIPRALLLSLAVALP